MTELERVLQVCTQVLEPLIRRDGGELTVVRAEGNELVLRLTGRCAGCPGATLTQSTIIEPAIRAVAPRWKVTVTTGFSGRREAPAAPFPCEQPDTLPPT